MHKSAGQYGHCYGRPRDDTEALVDPATNNAVGCVVPARYARDQMVEQLGRSGGRRTEGFEVDSAEVEARDSGGRQDQQNRYGWINCKQ